MNRDDAIISRFSDDEPGTLYETVAADQLPFAGSRGYALVAVLYEDIVVTSGGDDTHYLGVVTRHDSMHVPGAGPVVVARQARYLMRKDAASALREAHESLKRADEREDAATRKLRELESRAAEHENEKKRMQADLQTVKHNYAAAVGGREADLASKRKLEADIAKIRIALGDLRMKEILGS